MLNRILGWSRAAKRMVVVAMDICLGIIAMWLAFTLRLETPHWPSGMQWLAYALVPALAFPIFAKLGLYRAIFRYTGITALITTGKAVAIYGALLLGCLLAAQWEGVPRSVGILQPLLFMLLVGASRALGWLALAGRSSHAPYRLLIYGAGSAGAQTAAGLGSMRQVSTAWRTWLMMDVTSYCCAAVERSLPSSNTISSCCAAFLRFLGLGMGVMNSARLRVGRICWVGCPSASSSQ